MDDTVRGRSPAPATLKMAELARRAGVPVPTIHFYIREGLLPKAPRKTSRNMAYYDESFVGRIQLIRRLQEERRLPLRDIRALLAHIEGGGEGTLDLMQAQARLLPLLSGVEPGAELSRGELLERTGADLADLDELQAMNVLTPRGEGRAARYSPEDQAIARAVARIRGLGLSRELFPASDLGLYQRAMSALVGDEASLFARRMRSSELSSPAALEAAIHTLGEIIVQLRQKLIGALLAGLRSAGEAEQRAARSRRRASRR